MSLVYSQNEPAKVFLHRRKFHTEEKLQGIELKIEQDRDSRDKVKESSNNMKALRIKKNGHKTDENYNSVF